MRLAGFLHWVSNESEVRGLWSVIIFIWMTVGWGGGAEGASAHLSHPRVTVHCLAAAVMSTMLLLSVGDGTSKNKRYLSLSTHDNSERNGNVHAVFLTIWGIMKDQEKAEPHPNDPFIFYLCAYCASRDAHTNMHTDGDAETAVFTQGEALGVLSHCHFTYFWIVEHLCLVPSRSQTKRVRNSPGCLPGKTYFVIHFLANPARPKNRPASLLLDFQVGNTIMS